MNNKVIFFEDILLNKAFESCPKDYGYKDHDEFCYDIDCNNCWKAVVNDIKLRLANN